MPANGNRFEREEASIGELLRRLSEDTSELVRQEMALARAELTEQGKQVGIGAGLLGGAAVATLLALGALTAAVIAGLDEIVPLWLAATIAAALWAAIAGALALRGRGEVREATPPAAQTVETVKEDVQWAKTLR
ncbi:MAG: phage holin family protein [Thermoleophilia bacterium]|nr:phage holin family protein [Thermoleophilia bacterium]